MPPSLAFVIDELEVGGSQRQLYLLATGFAARGWPVQVVCLQPVLAMADDFQAAGVPVQLISKQRMFDFALLLTLRRFLCEKKIDIVHAFSSTAEVFGGIAARLCGCRFVASIRNHSEQLPLLHRIAKRIVCRFAEAIVANSQAGADAAVAVGIIPAKKTYVAPNGVTFAPLTVNKHTARAQLGIPAQAFVVVSVGRLVREKGYAATVELAARVRQRYPQVVFLIAGDGPLFAPLSQQIAACGLAKTVQLLGERRDTACLLAAADLYLNTSLSEGLSNSIMEAMSAGLAVLATGVGGTKELIEDGATGVLSISGDIDQTERLFARLLEDEPWRDALGQHARQAMLERYSVENMMNRVEQIYLSLLEPASA